jgi:cobalamin synthase
MTRTLLVVVHAGSGIAGLVVGLGSFAPPRDGDSGSWVRWVYLACIAVMFVTLIALVVVDWEGLDTTARVAFTALTGLAAAMMLRIVLAVRVASSREAGWQERYIGHVYFTYISLWMGFVILPALNLPMPQLTVPVIAVAVLLIGQTLVGRYKRRVLPES